MLMNLSQDKTLFVNSDLQYMYATSYNTVTSIFHVIGVCLPSQLEKHNQDKKAHNPLHTS